MKIALDISPINPKTGSLHAVRGVGYYISHLQDALKIHDKKNSYVFYSSQDEIPADTDLIHVPYFDPFGDTIPKTDKKVISTIHDLIPLVSPNLFPSGIRGKIHWQLQKRKLSSLSGIITDSHASKNDIQRLAGVNEKKISVVYLAADSAYKKMLVNATEKQRLRMKYNLPEVFALYVGDGTANKNLPRLVRAAKQANIPLVLVGKALHTPAIEHPWNNDLRWVQEQAKRDSGILILGFVGTDDLVAIYNLASVYCSVSLYEGFGLPALEAMQSGCPVISSKGGSLPEIVGDAGYFVDATDENSIAKAIGTVTHDKKLQGKLSEKGIAQAKQFSWKKVAEETIAAYEKAV